MLSQLRKLCVMQILPGSKICRFFFQLHLKIVCKNCHIERKKKPAISVDATREIQKVCMKRTKMLQNFMTHSVPGEKEEFEEPESNKQVYHLMYFTNV